MKPWYMQKTFWGGVALILKGVVDIINANYDAGVTGLIAGFTVISARQAISSLASDPTKNTPSS